MQNKVYNVIQLSYSIQIYQGQTCNKLIIGMDITRSRLSSITEQQNQQDIGYKTQSALLLVYHQLYTVNYTHLMDDSVQIFKEISDKIQTQDKLQLFNNYQPFTRAYEQQQSKRHNKLIESIQKSSMNVGKIFLSKEQLEFRLQQKLNISSPNASRMKQQKMSQTVLNSKNYKQDLDETAESRISLGDVIEKLNDFDLQRVQIKYQIYSEQNNKADNLYSKWTNLHKKMKQILQVYLNRVGNGKSLLQLYSSFDNVKNSKRFIEGYSQKQLMNKLDTYIQSLFLDERQILLYRNQTEKAKSLNSSALSQQKQIRKKLTYF